MDSTFFHRYDEAFLAFIAAGELRIPVHTETGRALGLHQRAWCVAGDHAPEFPVPLVHGLIELAEGPRLICRLDGVTPEAVAVGQAVQAHFDRQGLVFRPALDDGNKADK